APASRAPVAQMAARSFMPAETPGRPHRFRGYVLGIQVPAPSSRTRPAQVSLTADSRTDALPVTTRVYLPTFDAPPQASGPELSVKVTVEPDTLTVPATTCALPGSFWT